MAQGFFGLLPADVNAEALLRLPFEEATSKCQLFGICENENFWQRYVAEHYLVTAKSNDLSWRQVATIANDLLSQMFAHQKYPTFRFLPFLFQYVIVDMASVDIAGDTIDNVANQSLMSLSFLFSFIHGTVDTAIFRLYEAMNASLPRSHNAADFTNLGSLTYHHILTPFENEFTKQVMERMTRPTVYLTPTGPMTINFDADQQSAIYYIISTDTTYSFFNYVANQTSVLRNLIFAQYFSGL